MKAERRKTKRVKERALRRGETSFTGGNLSTAESSGKGG